MDIRVLQYFLTVAREESITAAAEALHMTQPPLSRQLRELEEELGVQLLVRGTRKVTLTEEGEILRKRAEELVELLGKTQQEVTASKENISGEVYIGAGETDSFRLISRAATALQEQYPGIHYRLSSGDGQEVMEQLDKGLVDFGVLFGPVNTDKYEAIPFPRRELRGVLMRRDSELAEKSEITGKDLRDKPLLISRQPNSLEFLQQFTHRSAEKLNVVSTYSLIYNASRMVSEGFGYAVTVEGLVNTEGTNLCFTPFSPRHEVEVSFVWKKYQVFSKAAAKFLEQVQKELSE